MPLRTTCEGCGKPVLGITTGLEEVDGKYLCSFCATQARENAANPNLAKCGVCGKWISTRAAACPQCGVPRS
jgi:DNA-directed RNA polymerase subunit RPC12/RpoP